MIAKVMIIEDEKRIADAIGYALKKEGYTVEIVYNGEEALNKIQIFQPEVIILDVMLPGMDGYEILKKLQNKKHIGVVMLTAKEDIVNKILGLELGADDYITKPFDMRELLARIKSLLRRMETTGRKQDQREIRLGKVMIHPNERTVFAADVALELTPKEYDLLLLLLSSPNQVFSREQLLDLVWGIDFVGGTRTVDIHIQRIRKKLVDCGDIIQTVHGVGYKALGGYGEN